MFLDNVVGAKHSMKKLRTEIYTAGKLGLETVQDSEKYLGRGIEHTGMIAQRKILRDLHICLGLIITLELLNIYFI